MTNMKKIVCIVGKICSGKSYLAKEIQEKFETPIVSFGKYLVDYSKQHKLPTDRSSLQDLGNRFIIEDVRLFVHNTIAHADLTVNQIIIEGIRHIKVKEAIKERDGMCYFIYCDTSDEIRYQRFLDRTKEEDTNKSQESFFLVNNHVVENEIPLLKSECDFILGVDDQSRKQLFKEVQIFLGAS